MNDGPIDRYLDELQARLLVPPARVRRILAESEDHLREAASRHATGGLPAADAEARAVEEFGSVREVAARFRQAEGAAYVPALVAEVVLALVLLVGVGFAAVGASGAVASAMGFAFGKGFVAGDAPGVTYTAAQCEVYLRILPDSPGITCADAVLDDHYWGTMMVRGVAGIVSLVLLPAAWLARRAYRRRATMRVLPPSVVPAMGATAFGLVAFLMLVAGVDAFIAGPAGSGALLSGGLVALAGFAGYGAAFVRELRAA